MEARETASVESLLQSFLQSRDEEEAELLLAQIISNHAGPLILDIIKYKIVVSSHNRNNQQDAEDVYNDALLSLLSRLQARRRNSEEKPITNFRSYVAAIAYNTCHEYLREKYPARHALKNRLRYLLTHDREFALWEVEREWFCGLAAWQAGGRSPAAMDKVQALRDNRQAIDSPSVSADETDRNNLTSLVKAIFENLRGPVEIDDLVNLVADFCGVKDRMLALEEDENQSVSLSEQLPDSRADFASELEQRSYLKKLWSEIGELPDRQRAALLLNLKDSQGSGISLFQMTGIATIIQIAETLSVSPEELARLWNELPLDDLAIASRLSVTRQQVINLRKSARERLARRMKNYL